MSRAREVRSARTAVVLSAAVTVLLAASLLGGCAAVDDASSGDRTAASNSSDRDVDAAATPSHDPSRTLAEPALTDVAMQLVSSAENSNLDWKANYGYLEDIGDDRGYTGGIIGFTTATGDLLEVVERYAKSTPGTPLAAYLPALKKVVGSPSHDGLGAGFEQAWAASAADPAFIAAQDAERDALYLDPAVVQGTRDGVGALGQFIYFDALVMHGPGSDHASFGGIHATALKHASPPSEGGDETEWLNAVLDARVKVMREEAAHDDTSRVDTEQRVFLKAGNLDLRTPLVWRTYGDRYEID